MASSVDTDQIKINRAAIVGVGLIGGSVAAAWRETGFIQHIIGIEADIESGQVALDRGLIDEVADTVPQDVELIAVCTPSDQIAQWVAKFSSHPGVVLDVGSVKGPIVQALLDGGKQVPARFVPSHPIAGSEQSGPQAARADLFQGATVVITPTSSTDPDAVQVAYAAWQATGATVVELSPAEHDEMLAVTSHLPHLLAFAYMHQVDPRQLDFAGGGFRDFSRIAASNPELWWRILKMNKSEVLAAARQFSEQLEVLTTALAADDDAAGIAALSAAAKIRQRLDP